MRSVRGCDSKELSVPKVQIDWVAEALSSPPYDGMPMWGSLPELMAHFVCGSNELKDYLRWDVGSYLTGNGVLHNYFLRVRSDY
jgi:hypothetical protein